MQQMLCTGRGMHLQTVRFLSSSPRFFQSPDRLERSPTLSYTHGLERRVKDLEQQLESLRDQLTSQQEPPSTGNEASTAPPNAPNDFQGLKIDRKGVATYHGSTSFFHLLEPAGEESSGSRMSGRQKGDESKQKLVMNAWQQRAQENLARMPVCHTTSRNRCFDKN